MIKIFDGKSFGDALKDTKRSLDELNNQSSLSHKYLSNTDIDVCNTVLYDNEANIAVIDPDDNESLASEKNKKVVITKCVNISNHDDYQVIMNYIDKLTQENNISLPHTIIIPYTFNNSANALIYEIKQEKNEIDYYFKTKFLYKEDKFEQINSCFKKFADNDDLDLDSESFITNINNDVFNFLSTLKNVATAASAKKEGEYLDYKSITVTTNIGFEQNLNKLITSKINDDDLSVATSYYNPSGSVASKVDSIIPNDNIFKRNEFFSTIENNFNSKDVYSIEKTKDSILITGKLNNQQIIKAQANKTGISVNHDGSDNTWQALFAAMNETENFKCEFSFTGNVEDSKKLAEQFLQAVNNEIDENTGILNNVIFDMDEKTKDIINQVLNDPDVIKRLEVDKVLTYFGINDHYPEIESKNTTLFESQHKNSLKPT